MQEEFQKLMSKDPQGLLRPTAIVKAAENPNSPLHGYFTWDDDVAAERWRLEEARHLIKQVQVYIEPLNISVRAYASLDMDREASGGWRSMTEIMSNPDLRVQLLSTALRELQSLESRYSHLQELNKVWDASHGVEVMKARKKRVKKEATA